MADSKLNLFADVIVAAVKAGLPPGDDTEVKWSMRPEVLGADFDPTAVRRRTVYVVPLSRRQSADHRTRQSDLYDYEVGVLVANRYAGAPGDPEETWVRGEMGWQEARVDGLLTSERTEDTPPEVLADAAFCTKSDPAYVFDVESIQTQRLFLALQLFTFQKTG